MSAIIGTIKAVMGQVWIVASNGTRRLATEGEQVMRGELVVTDQGAVTVTLPSGKNMDLGRGSEWGSEATPASASADVDSQAIAAAQQAIAEGADPTQILEATAAGNSTIIDSSSAPTGDHSGHTHVILDLTGEILDPTAGYPTEGLDTATIAPVEDITLLKPDVVSSSNDEPHPLPEASITIDVIAGDNVINMREAEEETTKVSGGTGLDVRPGDTVTVTINGHDYFAMVQEDGSWSVNVNTSDLLASGDVLATVTTRDAYGNEATASEQSSVGQASLSVAITIDAIGEDGYLNNDELKEIRTDVKGSSDAPEGTIVTLTIGDTVIGEAVVGKDGRWSTTVDTSVIKDGATVTASVEVSDKYGNEVPESASTDVAPAPLSVEITIDAIGKDGYLNNEELKEVRTDVQGSSDAPAGTIVTLTIGDTVIGEAVVGKDGR
ncbi:retention module-containing protein, partial [Kluyvera sichuanensis]|uniref:retention module-containing protein n=2 Tax=Kluyvera sichuanensis TaxID=2725494 RepID=UPI002FD15E1C